MNPKGKCRIVVIHRVFLNKFVWMFVAVGRNTVLQQIWRGLFLIEKALSLRTTIDKIHYKRYYESLCIFHLCSYGDIVNVALVQWTMSLTPTSSSAFELGICIDTFYKLTWASYIPSTAELTLRSFWRIWSLLNSFIAALSMLCVCSCARWESFQLFQFSSHSWDISQACWRLPKS